MKVVNTSGQSITLQDGTILAAAGTPGSTKEVADITLSASDRRHVDAGRIVIAQEAVTPKRAAAPKPSDSQEVSAPIDEPESKPRQRGGRTNA